MKYANNIKYLINQNKELSSIYSNINIAKEMLSQANTQAEAILDNASIKSKSIFKESIKQGYELGRSQGLASLINLPTIKNKILEESSELMLSLIQTILEELFKDNSSHIFSESNVSKNIKELIGKLDLTPQDLSKTKIQAPALAIPSIKNILAHEELDIKLEETNENVISILTEDGSVTYSPEIHLKNLLLKTRTILKNSRHAEEIIDLEIEYLEKTLIDGEKIHA